MGNQLISSVVTVLTAIIGLAILAVLVSKQANTTGVINAGGNFFTNALQVAESPVTSGGFGGGGYNIAGTYGGAGYVQ
jgi:PRD1 phage membrane DNA delivery